MRVSNDGTAWNGTFALTVRFMVQDVLSDGEPFEAEVEWAHTTRREAVTITAIDGLTMETPNGPISIDDIVGLEVAA